MRTLVTYWTHTGNTRRIAETMFGVIPGEKEILTLDWVSSFEDYQLIFLGFPVMQFGPPPPVKEFLLRNAGVHSVALFITHALPCSGNDPAQQAFLEKELQRCTKLFTKTKLWGIYHCQGELSQSAATELMATGNPMLMQFAGMRPVTIGHPDREELDGARQFALKIIQKVEGGAERSFIP